MTYETTITSVRGVLLLWQSDNSWDKILTIFLCYLSPAHDASEELDKCSSHEAPTPPQIKHSQELYWIRVNNYHGWARVRKVQVIVEKKGSGWKCYQA